MMKKKTLGVGALIAAAAALAIWAGAAYAEGGQPLSITSFTMKTIASTKVIALPNEAFEFVNEPYAFTQAGGHPWGLTTTLELSTEEVEEEAEKALRLVPTRDAKDAVVELPPGLIGDPQAVPRCPLAVAFESKCPPSSQVGVYRIRWFEGKEYLGPIVNVIPEAGQTAEFTFENEVKINPIVTGHLIHVPERAGLPEGYSLSVVSNEIPPVEVSRVETTFWGVPADPSHDPERGLLCASVRRGRPITCKPGSGDKPAEVAPVPFLTMPTDCSAGPQVATARVDSWQEPGHRTGQRYEGYTESQAEMPGVTGCDALPFDPAIEVQPDTQLADEPVGLGVNVLVPQFETPGRLATPHLRNAAVTLPLGMSVSPSVVDGIQACNQSGPDGINFTGPESEEVAPSGELQLAPGRCPAASTVGTAEAITPLLSEPVKGHVYLARPLCGGENQPACTEQDAAEGRLYRLYLELGGTGPLANTGIHIKAEGKVEANPATGQLTTVFEDNPQTPFGELKIHLNGGPRASIDTPAACGPAGTTSDFTPWSASGITPQGLAMAGTPDATPSSHFDVIGCQNPPPFSPSVFAGTVSPQGGHFSSLTLNLSRQDREQYVKGIEVRTPPGLLGVLANVPLCGEPQAEAGTCPDASKIGTTRVASGAGSHPFEIEGTVYLTGPHDGAPFGLSVVTHVVAGPFDLGLVVVRAGIEIDRHTSTLTVTTDQNGPHAIPQLVFGVPLRLRRVTVDIDRSDFIFNPTNCAAQQVTARVFGSAGAIAEVPTRFASTGCRSLEFKPKFTATTSGRTSRSLGASLDTKLSFPKGSFGSEANVARVKVSLPKALPSRLTTLQKACTVVTFESNPSLCPPGSIVGIAKAQTPLLPDLPTSAIPCIGKRKCAKPPPASVIGPVYFVSHGGESFPQLIIVLQGDGVRVDLAGSTFISRAGITSSTFKTVPDVPVDTFELYLPQGRSSALAANGNLCGKRGQLVIPTEMVAQNGAVFKQRTRISVTGCSSRRRSSRSAHGRHASSASSGANMARRKA